MSHRVLLLSPWGAPHKVISWQTAVCLIYTKKACVVEEYDEVISSPSVTMKMPAVCQLIGALDRVKRHIKFSPVNVFTRDSFRCCYCGDKKPMRELNYDHVVPRAQGGKTVWENIVTSCYPCNLRKGNRTPEQAGMKLLKKPYRPKTLPMSYLHIERKSIPKVWEPYCGAQIVEEHRSGLFLLSAS